MMDWRSLRQAQIAQSQFSQNPQKKDGDGEDGFGVRNGVLKLETQQGSIWRDAWREVAALTHGIQHKDPRFKTLMIAIEKCDVAFLAGDWAKFQGATMEVYEAVHATRSE